MTVGPANSGQETPKKTIKQGGATGGVHPDSGIEEELNVCKTDVDKADTSSGTRQNHDVTRQKCIEESTIPADRLKQLLERVSDGTYDRPEVIEETARRLFEEL